MKRNGIKLLLGGVFIVVACSVAYIPAVRGDFIWDDDRYLTNNPLIVAPDGLGRIWFSTGTPSQYFPLVYTTFWYEHKLWGFNPVPYHITNMGLHIISSLLLWLILRRLLIPGAFVAAAIFALHPVNVESVAWITERKNVLMLSFFLLSLLFWIDFTLRSRTTGKAVLFYVLSLFCYALALLSKTTACFLPVALILVLWLKHIPFKRKRLLFLAPYFAMGIGMGLLTMWWEHHHQGTGLLDIKLDPVEHVLLAARALWFYAGKIFFPVNLVFSYPTWKIDSSDLFQYFWLLACLLVGLFLWLWRRKLGRGPVVAIVFFVAALLPMLGFIPAYTFVYTWVADHYQYMSAIALITLAVAVVSRLLGHLGKYAKAASSLVAALVLTACAGLTWRQCHIYTSREALWKDTLEKNPDSWLAHSNMANVCFIKNEPEQAMWHNNRMLEIIENAPFVRPYDFAYAHFNNAATYRYQGKYDDAIKEFRLGLEYYPYDGFAHYDLANMLVRVNRLDEAIVEYDKSMKIIGDSPEVCSKLADIYIRQGDPNEAINCLHRALNVAPGYFPALAYLVGISNTHSEPDIRDATRAVEFARRAAEQTKRKDPVILSTLAMALGADNQLSEAVATAEEALELSIAVGADDVAAFCRMQLNSYRKKIK